MMTVTAEMVYKINTINIYDASLPHFKLGQQSGLAGETGILGKIIHSFASQQIG
jgi:hypothetical protein